MNHALLHQLQQMRSYPSVTILFNTRPGSTFGTDEVTRARHLGAIARERLDTLLDADPAPLLDVADLNRTTIVEPSTLEDCGRIAAVLRY